MSGFDFNASNTLNEKILRNSYIIKYLPWGLLAHLIELFREYFPDSCFYCLSLVACYIQLDCLVYFEMVGSLVFADTSLLVVDS